MSAGILEECIRLMSSRNEANAPRYIRSLRLANQDPGHSTGLLNLHGTFLLTYFAPAKQHLDLFSPELRAPSGENPLLGPPIG